MKTNIIKLISLGMVTLCDLKLTRHKNEHSVTITKIRRVYCNAGDYNNVQYCLRSPNLLLPSNGTDSAAATCVLGIPDATGVTCSLLPPTPSPANYYARGDVSEWWISHSHPPSGCLP